MGDGRVMARRILLLGGLFVVLLYCGGHQAASQQDSSSIRVNVVLVQLNVAVTDHKGNYVSGLRPEDFEIMEDKIPETIATFEEGNERTIRTEPPSADKSSAPASVLRTAHSATRPSRPTSSRPAAAPRRRTPPG